MGKQVAYQNAGLSPLVRGKHYDSFPRVGVFGSIPACAGETSGTPVSDAAGRVYPRLCGGNKRATSKCPTSSGLSPLVRGKQVEWIYQGQSDGSIPACAGETVGHIRRFVIDGVYPRLCGGNPRKALRASCLRGLSPLVRGKPEHGAIWLMCNGSIPACAGETDQSVTSEIDQWVYPRLCGGNSAHFLLFGLPLGLSPLVRGKLPNASSLMGVYGSIPACAGETATGHRPL